MTFCKFQYANHIRSKTLKPFDYFHETWYKYKASSDDVQKLSTINPSTIFTGIMLFCKLRSPWGPSEPGTFDFVDICTEN